MSQLKLMIIFSLWLFFSKIICVTSNKQFLRVQLKSLKCNHDPTIYNGTLNCFIKPFRNKTQLATSIYTFGKPCNDMWLEMVVYYKFGGTALYRPWYFKLHENLCEIFGGVTEPTLLAKIMIDIFNQITPGTIHKCPYVGDEGIKNVNIDQIVGGVIPHVLPNGDYRILFRFHTALNKTFLEVTFGGYIDAINPLDAIPMG